MRSHYTDLIAPICFPGKTFLVTCADQVVRGRIEDYIQARGGTLAVSPDYLVGENGWTPVQFWIGAGEYDRLQASERMEEALIFLSSETPFSEEEREKVLWYIRENREAVISEMLAKNLTEALQGYLTHYHQVLPQDYLGVLQPGQYQEQILLDLTDELIDRTARMQKHELKAWLLEYKKNTFSKLFVDKTEQEKLDKELGFTEQNAYDWLRQFSFTYEADGVHIERYKGEDPFVFIPAEIDGKPVTSVAVRNFYGCQPGWQFAWERPESLLTPVYRELLSQAEVGDSISFGLYPLDKEGNTAPIEWVVLDKTDSRLLVITKFCIDKSAYHGEMLPVDWERCHLRRWLNGAFLQLAFTPEEQAIIPAVVLENKVNPKYGTPGGSDTTDRVFVLSLEEAEALFPDDESRLGNTTLYAQSRGYYFGGKINCWWLRNPGASPELTALVGNSGSLGTYGYRPDNGEYAIRPAMWIAFGGDV